MDEKEKNETNKELQINNIEDFDCAICLMTLVNPISLSCGHK